MQRQDLLVWEKRANFRERDGGVCVSGLPLILQECMKRRILVLHICERDRRENSKVKDIVLM